MHREFLACMLTALAHVSTKEALNWWGEICLFHWLDRTCNELASLIGNARSGRPEYIKISHSIINVCFIAYPTRLLATSTLTNRNDILQEETSYVTHFDSFWQLWPLRIQGDAYVKSYGIHSFCCAAILDTQTNAPGKGKLSVSVYISEISRTQFHGADKILCPYAIRPNKL